MSDQQPPFNSAPVAVPGFRFIVVLDNDKENKAAFTECTLPVLEWDAEEIKEGGNNAYIHQVPGRRRAAKLTLKNGVGNRQMLKWYTDAISGVFTRHSVSITLLNLDKKTAVAVWHIEGAFPVQWTGPDLRAGDNTIAIQTLQLACREITVEIPEEKK